MSVMSPLFAGEHFCLRGNDRNKRVTVARVPPPFTLTAGRAETPAGNAAWKVRNHIKQDHCEVHRGLCRFQFAQG